MITDQQDALHTACRTVGLTGADAIPLRHHATSVYLLPAHRVVARIAPASAGDCAQRAVQLTRWLCAQGFPATEPADVADQPVPAHGHVVTFWRYYPQPDDATTAPPRELGHLLRHLHALPAPPVPLPAYQPLSHLRATVAAAVLLPEDIRTWLLEHRQRLLDAYDHLEFPLDAGHIHGDAYTGNLLRDGAQFRLGDWDEAAWGPRELDLANTYQGRRFGRTDAELDEFAAAYGHDLRHWDGLALLTDMRDLHTLGSFIRQTELGNTQVLPELRRRITDLTAGDRDTRWTPR